MNEIKDYIRNLKETKPPVKNFDHNYIRNLKESKPQPSFLILQHVFYYIRKLKDNDQSPPQKKSLATT